MNKKINDNTKIKRFLILSYFLAICFLSAAAFGQTGGSELQTQILTIDEAIAESMKYFSSKLAAGTKVVVLNIESESQNLSDYIIDESGMFIANNTKLTLLDKSELPNIMQKRNINDLDKIDESLILQIGRELGASGVIFGNVSKFNENYRFRVQILRTDDGRVFGVQSLNVEKDEILADLLGTGALPEKSVSKSPQNIVMENENGDYGDSNFTSINGIECVLVKAGTFMMGSSSGEANRRSDEIRHKVIITQDYYISKYPITNAQYGKLKNADHPVVNVTWTEANNWANNKGGRLPTEAEWEFAARGGNKSEGYIYSGGNNLNDVAWYGGNNSPNGTKPTGQKQPNELGIYDMSGNVSEWCGDWYGSYPAGTVTDPTGAGAGGGRVMRGGNWSYFAGGCRVAYRSYGNPSYDDDDIGFRVVFPRK